MPLIQFNVLFSHHFVDVYHINHVCIFVGRAACRLGLFLS